MFYAARSELEGSMEWDTDILTEKYKIWVAHYPDYDVTADMKSSYLGIHDMWQYTSKEVWLV